jgi:hypothetical protein
MSATEDHFNEPEQLYGALLEISDTFAYQLEGMLIIDMPMKGRVSWQ